MADSTFLSATTFPSWPSGASPTNVAVPGGIPAGAEVALIWFGGYDTTSVSQVTSNFTTGDWTIFEQAQTPATDVVAVAYARVTSSPGSPTVSASFAGFPSTGPAPVIAFLDDVTAAGTWIGDIGTDADPGNNAPVVTINSGANMLLLAYESHEGAIPALPSGWTNGAVYSAQQNLQGARVSYRVGTPGPTTTYTGSGGTNTYATALVISVLGVSSGGTTHATTGALAGQGSTVVGSAARNGPHPTTGALTGQGAAVSGTAARTRAHPSSGSLVGPGSAVAGSAARTRAHPTSGVLTGQGSAIAGSAARTRVHPASGDLVGQGSSVAGSADRQSAAGVHDTSGALVGQGSLIAGSANRVPNHSTTGSLIGQGSTVAGAATRFRAFSTSGALTGQGSAIAGAAARVAGPVSHATTGVLVGAGAEVNGSAARAGPAVTHDTSGVLVGPGSSVAGEARIGELMQDTHDGFWAKQWDRIREREKKKHLEEIREDIEELDEQIAEVQAAEPPKPVKKALKVQAVPQRNFYAEQARVIEQLIAERQRMIEMEEEEMLLLL